MAGTPIWLTIGIALIIIGFIIIFAFSIYSAAKSSTESKSEVGGVIMIGPIPIIFGSSWKAATLAIILSIVLIAIAIVFLMMGRYLYLK
ncbi:MAG: DUF131 domain-containing protein [Caldisphaeraceae archaeon]|nr:DUF131 domain-containing protein [Caldisphaeraceae archaeon]